MPCPPCKRPMRVAGASACASTPSRTGGPWHTAFSLQAGNPQAGPRSGR